MKKLPPKKQPGQGKVNHTINGAALDVRSAAAFLGMTDKALRGMMARQCIPHRRINSRIVFIRAEIEAWLIDLPGVTLDEARMNQEERRG